MTYCKGELLKTFSTRTKLVLKLGLKFRTIKINKLFREIICSHNMQWVTAPENLSSTSEPHQGDKQLLKVVPTFMQAPALTLGKSVLNTKHKSYVLFEFMRDIYKCFPN